MEMHHLRSRWILTVVTAALWVGSCAAGEADSAKLTAAKAALDKAVKAHKVVHDEWYSKEMARSATREIAVSARATVEKAEQDRAAAEKTLSDRVAAAKAAREAATKETDAGRKADLAKNVTGADVQVPAAQKRVAQRNATLRAALERLITDQRVADEAADENFAIERTLGERLAGIRAAETAVCAAEAEAAQCLADKSAADLAVASRQAADKTGPEKEKAEKAVAQLRAAAKAAEQRAQAAKRALAQAKFVAAWEAQQWLAVLQDTQSQIANQDSHAAQIARRLATTEPDSKRTAELEALAGKLEKRHATAKMHIEEFSQAIQCAVPQIYPLRAAAEGGLKPLAPEAWDYAKARHLLVRAGFGGTPQEVAKLHSLGLYRAVDHLVDFHQHPPADVSFDAVPPSGAYFLEDKLRNDFIRGRVAGARQSAERAQLPQLRQWWLRRMVESPRPLQEKLTLLWHGHFATQYSVVQNSYAIYHQNQLLREHAAGNFGGLLYGIVHDPVMIRYLDNNTNIKGHANENLAREIMELFSMGAYQGYTEKDVREASRALTGYTFDNRTGQFRFVGSQHDEGPKTIFGKSGNYTGDDLVALILDQPATSRFIARKLFEFFAYQDPSDQMIESVAQVLTSNRYEIAPVLKNLFLSEEFYSPRAMGTQIKCPVQLVVGAMRDLGVKRLANAGLLDNAVREMGQELFEPPDVKGWRYGRPWINTNRIFDRYNATANLVRSVPLADGRSGVDVVGLIQAGGCKCSDDVVAYLANACLQRPLSEAKRKELIGYLGALPPADQWSGLRDALNRRLQGLLVLMLSTPEFQIM
jgi:hypothetical protein